MAQTQADLSTAGNAHSEGTLMLDQLIWGLQVGGWLASWLWSTPAVTDQAASQAARAQSEQAAASEHRASATGTAAWDLIAAHGWDLLQAASLRCAVMSLLTAACAGVASKACSAAAAAAASAGVAVPVIQYCRVADLFDAAAADVSD